MKYYYLKKLTGLFIMLGLLAACSSSTKKKTKEPKEPNNTILKAGMLKSGQTYTMKIDSIGDIDWYSIAVPGQGYVRISTKTVPKELSLEVRFAEKQAWKPEKQKWLSGWEDIPKTISVKKADTLYFAIIDDYNDKASKEKIEFKADFIEELDEYESNDGPKQAAAVRSGEIMKTSFFPKTDNDWFKIKVDTPGYLMIQAKNIPEGIEVDTRYAKKKSEFGKVKFITDWQELPSGIQVTEPGTYYFDLIDNYHDAMAREKAEWKIVFITEVDSTEPNNNYNSAYPLAINDTVKTAIFPLGDNDYYTITPDSATTIHLASTHPENIKIDVRLHLKEGFETNPVGDWEELPTQFQLEGGKQYFLQVIDDYNDEYSKDPVVIKLLEVNKAK